MLEMASIIVVNYSHLHRGSSGTPSLGLSAPSMLLLEVADPAVAQYLTVTNTQDT